MLPNKKSDILQNKVKMTTDIHVKSLQYIFSIMMIKFKLFNYLKISIAIQRRSGVHIAFGGEPRRY